MQVVVLSHINMLILVIYHQLARPKLKGVDLAMIQKIVAENDKQRYQLLQAADDTAESSEGVIWWIRANQGHTLKVIGKVLKQATN